MEVWSQSCQPEPGGGLTTDRGLEGWRVGGLEGCQTVRGVEPVAGQGVEVGEREGGRESTRGSMLPSGNVSIILMVYSVPSAPEAQ